MFFKMFKSRGGTAETISYKGPPFPHLLHVLVSFTDLKHLRVVHSGFQVDLQNTHNIYLSSHTSAISPLRLMERLPSLTTLKIDLQFLRLTDKPFFLGDHNALENIVLSGGFNELKAFVSENRSHSLRSLSLGVPSTFKSNSWRTICVRASENFPSLRSFTVEGMGTITCPPIAIRDITPLFSLPLFTFALKGIPHRLNTHNIGEIYKGWPNLRNLTLVSRQKFLEPAILVSLSEFHRLRTLTVRVNLGIRNTVEDLKSHATSPQPQSWLEELILVDPDSSLPSTIEGKFDLAHALLGIFPNLLTISSNPEFGSDQNHDMQKTLTVYNGIVFRISSQIRYPLLVTGQPVSPEA